MLPFYFDTYEFGRTYCAIVCDQTVGSLAVYFSTEFVFLIRELLLVYSPNSLVFVFTRNFR